MITIKSKGKPDMDKVPVNGTIDKRPESSTIKLQKDVAIVDHSTKNGGYIRDRNKSTGSYYKGYRVLTKNRPYNNEHTYTSRKYYDDGPKKRDDSFDSRSLYYSNNRNGELC